ncbi:amidohydrolase family protein [Wansuia hejianensis]|uniref:Amidohydrolase family protein n=1 Tax=Wansuia hejianensis TaxID=2763667 RepID=A0A926ILZ8_9FIRM|nr:amidohydrolase family protein [Wansuia hejianensis]MBC8590684.1 amidohydrolase family protein [Wansuia hejianensis]
MIIDIHGHYYSEDLYPSWVPFGINPLLEWSNDYNIDIVAVSSLDAFSNGIKENTKLTSLCTRYPKLWQFVSIDPRIPFWWDNIPKSKKILGLKIHPTWSNYNLVDVFNQVLEVAKNKNLAVLTHPGINEPYIDMEKSILIADKYPEVPVIFAHLGNGFSSYNDVLLQIECLRKTKNQNTLIDTSSLAIHLNGLLEQSVNMIGSHRILFGTDLPLHFPKTMLDRVVKSKLSANIKDLILYKNSISYLPQLKEV